jgi:hypothetical protein
MGVAQVAMKTMTKRIDRSREIPEGIRASEGTAGELATQSIARVLNAFLSSRRTGTSLSDIYNDSLKFYNLDSINAERTS